MYVLYVRVVYNISPNKVMKQIMLLLKKGLELIKVIAITEINSKNTNKIN